MRVWIDGWTERGGGWQEGGVKIRSSCQSSQQHWPSAAVGTALHCTAVTLLSLSWWGF